MVAFADKGTMKRPGLVCLALHLALLGVAPAALPFAASAGDHVDSPTIASDAGADIGDVYAFLDPTDITQLVLIATVHPFIVPGQSTIAASFDEAVRYRFEIFNEHVNVDSPVLDPAQQASVKKRYAAGIKPQLTIDVTFDKKGVGSAPQSGAGGLIPTNLRRPVQQSASLVFTGFEDTDGRPLANKGRFPAVGAPLLYVSSTSLSPTAPPFLINDLTVGPGLAVRFFAGMVDDPFFFDLPAFQSFLDGIRDGGAPNAGAFARARDTFAGYNALAIALRIPLVLVEGANGPKLGVDFLAQRHRNEVRTTKGRKGVGTFVTVDRAGHPLVNSILVPLDRSDLYNAASARSDASLVFLDDIAETLEELGLVASPPEPSFDAFLDLLVAKGDLLQLDTSISNLGSPAGAGYPNGRRLADDTVDFFLTLANHGATVSDGVNNSGGLSASFPFLRTPNQPLATGSGTDDATRN